MRPAIVVFGAIGAIEIAAVRDVKTALQGFGRGDAYPIPKCYSRKIHGGLCQEASCNDERTSSLRQLAPEAIALKKYLFIAFALRQGTTQHEAHIPTA
jgi:hypothetical protein